MHLAECISRISSATTGQLILLYYDSISTELAALLRSFVKEFWLHLFFFFGLSWVLKWISVYIDTFEVGRWGGGG